MIADRRSPHRAVVSADEPRVTGADDATRAASGPPAWDDLPAAFYRRIAEPSASMVVVVGADLKVKWASESTAWIIGFRAGDLVGRDALDFLHPDDHELAIGAFGEAAVRDPKEQPILGRSEPVRVLTAEGPQWFDVGADWQLGDPDVQGMVIRLRPEPTQALLDQYLERSMADLPTSEILAPLLELLEYETPGSTVMLAHGWDGERFHHVIAARPSPLQEVVARGPADDEPATPWADAMADGRWLTAGADDVAPSLARLMADEGFAAVWVQPTTAPAAPGSCILTWREVAGAPWIFHSDAVQRTSRLAALAIERREYERRLVDAAERDGLTGLLNRRAFYDLLAAWPDDRDLAVLFIDLDGFKPINDTLGHTAGDEVLQIVAARLGRAVREHDIVARLGGDEFAVVVPGPVDRSDVETIASRIVQSTSEVMRTDAGAASVSVSVGIAFATGDGRSPEAAVTAADGAMYRAKAAGGNRWHLA